MAAADDLSRRRRSGKSVREMKINKTYLALGVLAGTGVAAAGVAGAGALGVSAVRRSRRSGSRDSFTGKVVLITGGSRGFGLAMAEEFGRLGARLVLTARNPDELASARGVLLSSVAGLREENIEIIPCDLTDSEQTKRMISTATGRFGTVDVLVNNAGIITVGPVENQPLSAFQNAIESNYYTMLHATLAVLPQMLARGNGAIVNITSIGGKVAVPHLLPYSASKFAALGFSQGLHAELRSKGIRVTTVCPGLMRTGSQGHAMFTGDAEREYRWFSLGASFPGLSTSARNAARKVVRAAARGATEITITPQAILAATFAQALPACTAAVMHLVNSLILPAPSDQGEIPLVPGRDVRGKELSGLMPLGKEAAARLNESKPQTAEGML